MEEKPLPPTQIGAGTGKDGRITKGDVLAFLDRPAPTAAGSGRQGAAHATSRARSG